MGIYPAGRDSARLLVCLRGRILGPGRHTPPVPFVLYLIAGIVPWFFFQDGLIGGTNSMLEYSYLVKKVADFRSVCFRS